MQTRIGRRIGATLAAAALVTAGAVSAPGTAEADIVPEHCGPGYVLAAHVRIGDGTAILANAFLGRNSAGTYCTFTERTETHYSSYTSAWLKRVGDEHYKHDGGDYSRYAGPVYRSRSGGCLTYGGTVESSSGGTYRNWDTRGPSSCGGH